MRNTWYVVLGVVTKNPITGHPSGNQQRWPMLDLGTPCSHRGQNHRASPGLNNNVMISYYYYYYILWKVERVLFCHIKMICSLYYLLSSALTTVARYYIIYINLYVICLRFKSGFAYWKLARISECSKNALIHRNVNVLAIF